MLWPSPGVRSILSCESAKPSRRFRSSFLADPAVDQVVVLAGPTEGVEMAVQHLWRPPDA